MLIVTTYFVKDLLPKLTTVILYFLHRIERLNLKTNMLISFCFLLCARALQNYVSYRRFISTFMCGVLPGWEDSNNIRGFIRVSPGTYRNKFALLVYNRTCVYSQNRVVVYINKLYLHAGK